MKRPFLVALLGGALIGLLPGWLIGFVSDLYPTLEPEGLANTGEFFQSEFDLAYAIVLFILVFLAPVIEEYLFRGLLWYVVNKFVSKYWTLIITTVMFASLHMDLLHVLGVAPVGFFFGWLKYKTDRMGPSVVAHITNNMVACLFMIM